MTTWRTPSLRCALPCNPRMCCRRRYKLTEHTEAPEVVVLDHMFRSDVDRVNLRNVIQVLHALPDDLDSGA